MALTLYILWKVRVVEYILQHLLTTIKFATIEDDISEIQLKHLLNASLIFFHPPSYISEVEMSSRRSDISLGLLTSIICYHYSNFVMQTNLEMFPWEASLNYLRYY